MDRPDPVGALKRGGRPPRRHHQGRQPAPPQGPRRVGLALPVVLPAFQGPRQGPGSGPARQAPCDQGRPAARRAAGGHAGQGAKQEQGQRRHGARAGMLGLGRRPHGRIGLTPRRGRTAGRIIAITHPGGSIRGRWGESQSFFLRAQRCATRAKRLSSDEAAPAVATDCPARRRATGGY